MNFKYLFLLTVILVAGCSNKKSNTISLAQYLPEGKIGTKYISIFTHTGNDVVKEEKTIISKNNNCVKFDVKLIKNKQTINQYKKELCVKNNALYADNSLMIDLNKKNWFGYKMYINGDNTKMKCKFDGVGKLNFNTKTYDTLSIKCEAKNMTINFLFAKKLGLTKIKQTVSNYGVVGGMHLETVK